MANMDGKKKSVKAVQALYVDLSKTLKTHPDRKPVLNEMHTRLKAAVAAAKKAEVKELNISLDKSFKDKLIENIKSPRPKMKVEYLAGADDGKK